MAQLYPFFMETLRCAAHEWYGLRLRRRSGDPLLDRVAWMRRRTRGGEFTRRSRTGRDGAGGVPGRAAVPEGPARDWGSPSRARRAGAGLAAAARGDHGVRSPGPGAPRPTLRPATTA